MLLPRWLSVVALFAVPACATPSSESVGSTTPSAALAAIPQLPHVPLCKAVGQGHARCFAHIRTDTTGNVVASVTPQGFGPSDLQSAYAIPSGGAGKTVAIVDAFDDPNAETDLATYRAQFGLPPCTTANGCFHKVDQTGGSNYPQSDSDWGGEISLDLDMVSAICPGCNILLVETSSDDLNDLGTGVNTAASLGATTISNSYGGSEDSSVTQTSEQFYHHDGVVVTASSGDGGFGVEFPASSQYVVGVGGTSLVTSSNARGWVEGAWDGAGSGCSAFIPKPAFQTDTGCSQRTVADVSAVADPNTGLAVFDSFGQGGWIVLGGTSAASPIVAATFALTGLSSQGVTALYGNPSLVFDVTSGSNGSCGGSYLCTAGVGYDGPTGLGTPDGTAWAGGGSSGSSSGSGGGSGSSSGGSSGSSSGGGSGSSSGSGGGSGSSSGGGSAGPAITLVSPDDGASLPANSQVTLVADVTDGVALTQVVLEWQEPSGTVAVDCASPPTGATCTQSGNEYTWSFVGTTGARSWSVQATDASGNDVTSDVRSLTLGGAASTTTPTVTFDSPSQGDTYDAGQSVAVIVEASAPDGVSQVWLTWSSSAGDQQYPLDYLGGTQWGLELPPISGAGGDGARTLTVTAYDPNDVTGSSTVTIQVE